MTNVDSIESERYAVRGKLAIAGSLHEGAVVIEDGFIASVTRSNRNDELPGTVIEAEIVAPGFVDLQVNGGIGHEVAGNTPELRLLAAWLTSTGVTSFLPTAISSPARFYDQILGSLTEDAPPGCARWLGYHLEGPFLAPARKGAHPISAIEAADDALFERFLDAFDASLVTLAPEMPGNLDRIRRLREAKCLVSLGHTDATAEEITAGTDAGATMATHLFNAMSPFNHRNPGAIGAVLTDDRLVAGLIADGVHAHPKSVDLAVRAKGVGGIALVSDMMSAAGMPPGTYTLGGQSVQTDGVSARLADGTLAGSVLTMDAAVRNIVEWANVTPAEAIRMATEVPAATLGRSAVGALGPGKFADLTLLDRDLNVVRTIIGGEIVYERP